MKSCAAFLVLAMIYCASGVVGGPGGGCYYEKTKVTLALGETLSPVNVGACHSVSCTEKGLSILQCGLIAVPCKKPTLIGEDFSKPYPECCGKVECP